MTSSDPLVLRPAAHPWDGRRLQRSYRGSSLTASQGWLAFTPPTAARVAASWRLPIGTGAGMVHRLVHVRGVLAVGAQGIGSIRVNRVAALDAAGSVLAYFLPGPEASSKLGPVDWFPDDALAAFTQAVGLGYQQVRIHSPEELAQRFPGLYEAGPLRAAQAARWVNPFIYVAGGSSFVWVANVRSGSAPLPVRGVFTLLGLALVGLGVFASPPVMARLIRRFRRRGEQTDPGTSPPEAVGLVPPPATVTATASQPGAPRDKAEGAALNGSGGRHYRLLWHESGWVRARRLFLTRLPEATGPPSTALQLRMAALANLVLCIACDLLLMITAFVMAGVTQAHGGPLSKPGDAITPGVIAFAVAWWGLVALGLTFLVLAIARFLQSVREARLITTT